MTYIFTCGFVELVGERDWGERGRGLEKERKAVEMGEQNGHK